jgi:hypothetical protein
LIIRHCFHYWDKKYIRNNNIKITCEVVTLMFLKLVVTNEYEVWKF